MATGAAEMILKCIFSGSISLNDMEIKRRPYHRNCKCALHRLKDICSDACPKQRSLSFPKKQDPLLHKIVPYLRRNDKVGVSSNKLDRVFLDFSICSNYFRPDRTLSDTFSTLCTDSTPLGRLVLGLYGHLVPLTVSNFKTMCTSYSYKNTLVHKIFPGQFFLAGRQGRREKGEVKVPQDLARNFESVDSKAFKLTHSGPGILSLCLSENDDEDNIKLNPEYRNVEFLITTGPGPCPQLDYKNIVFGVVLEVANVPGCVVEITPLLNGQLSTVGSAFCKAFNSTNYICIKKMLALNPLFPSLLNDACGRTRGTPTAASATSKGSAGSEDRFA
ncbi:hypothetical protein D5086_013343 [Populus alba]|uniref:Uncharacterized protein n=1 Tax=Populus alba TaxID=43335 RepID=A0ACC4C5H9_POPAL